MENQTQPTIQPQMPAQPISEQKTEAKKPLPKLKLMALIILLLLVLTVPFGGYLLLGKMGIHPKPSTITIKTVKPTRAPTPTSATDPTATWKTYEGTGFSLKYPQDWITHYNTVNSESATIENMENKTLQFSLAYVYIDVVVLDPNTIFNKQLSEEEFYNFTSWYWDQAKSGGYYQQDSIKLASFNSKAVERIYHPVNNNESLSINQTYYSYSFWIKGKIVNIIFMINNKNTEKDKFIAIKDQILSTFKFTDQAPQGDESTNWSTYTNDIYGISLKYPSSWYPKDVTSISPGTHLANIDFFTNGTTPSISTEGHQGNELLNLYIVNNLNGSTVISESKDQFSSFYTDNLKEKVTTISGLPAATTNDNNKAYHIWYNDKIELSIFSNDPSVDKTTFERIISTMTIKPTQ